MGLRQNKGERNENHPKRRVDRENWVGQQVTLPQTGLFTVTGQDKRYVTGVTAEGRDVGRTGIGLLRTERLA